MGENWTSLKQHERRTERAEMEVFMSTAGYALYYYKTNGEIREVINTCIIHFKWSYCGLQMQGHNFDEEGIIHTWRRNMPGWLTTANHLLIFYIFAKMTQLV